MRIVFHDVAGPLLRTRFAELAIRGLVVDWCAPADDTRFNALLPETDVIWHALRQLSAPDMDRAPKLRLIQKIGVGVNTIDLDAAKARGISVCNMPGANARAVMEMTLLLMLSCFQQRSANDRAASIAGGALLVLTAISLLLPVIR